jgi:tetratricopeptide (TPR) repeat protein
MKTAPKADAREAARRYRYAGDSLREHWKALHQSDLEPWPDARWLATLARKQLRAGAEIEERGGPQAVAEALQEAWRAFHAGAFEKADALGAAIGPLGAAAAGKAAAVRSLGMKHGSAAVIELLTSAAERCERAVELAPGYANAHYTAALALGRYGQHISILTALAQGLAGRVESRLRRTLELEPHHAEAHVALGLYHAEIIHQVGTLAGFAYGVSSKVSLEHLNRALELAPASPVIEMEYARALLLLDSERYRAEAHKLYGAAAGRDPRDAMEGLYVDRAKKGLD